MKIKLSGVGAAPGTPITSDCGWLYSGKGLGPLLCGALLLAGVGCQTFSLSEDQFERQQQGQMADRQTGQAVEAVGTVAYLGAMIGAVAAGAANK